MDLDGTLLRTDYLHEAVAALAKQRPLLLFVLPCWLCRGKAYLKARLADAVTLDVSSLPYNRPLVDWLGTQRAAGRTIALATASPIKFARAVAAHVELFDAVLASDDRTNLRGRAKAEALVRKFGVGGFDYAGNSRADLPVWESARDVVLVNASGSVARAAAKGTTVHARFRSEAQFLTSWLRALRLHQWAKNLLVFVPLIVAHKMQHAELLIPATLAFLFAFYATALSASRPVWAVAIDWSSAGNPGNAADTTCAYGALG